MVVCNNLFYLNYCGLEYHLLARLIYMNLFVADMDKDIVEQIRKQTIGANEETTFDIRDVTNEAPYKIKGITYLISSHQFNIDPTPWDTWIVINGKLRKGYEIKDVLKEKYIFPKSKEEALDIAKLIIFAEGRGTRVYPEFNDRMNTGAKKPKVTEINGIYEIVLYTSNFPYTFSVKLTFRLGEGIYELKSEHMRSKS
jgi:hypothetical protein